MAGFLRPEDRKFRYDDAVTIGVPDTSARHLVAALEDARRGSLTLFGDLSAEEQLGERAHHLEPPIWEVGHVAWFQELWLLRHLRGERPLLPRGDGIYDSFHVSYKRRWDHDFPSRDATLEYAEEVLRQSVSRLGVRSTTLDERNLYWLAAVHEDMHAENLMAVRHTRGLAFPGGGGARSPAIVDVDPGYEPHDVEVAGGTFELGARRGARYAFDNEMWAHPVEVEPFRISSTPVTNSEFAEFVDAGGYTTRKYWDKRGWEWRRREGAKHPLFWVRQDDAWHERCFDDHARLEPWHPACCVNWHEARAFCRYAGRRLPTEAEWEMAATWDPADGSKRRYPWGREKPSPSRANVDWSFGGGGTIDVRALAGGDSAIGCRQMIGNVWEWTESRFEPYPGFVPGAYAEYSQPYFGKKPVLRGAAWSTRGRLAYATYRNFFIRHRRNIFAGFRTCAV